MSEESQAPPSGEGGGGGGGGGGGDEGRRRRRRGRGGRGRGGGGDRPAAATGAQAAGGAPATSERPAGVEGAPAPAGGERREDRGPRRDDRGRGNRPRHEGPRPNRGGEQRQGQPNRGGEQRAQGPRTDGGKRDDRGPRRDDRGRRNDRGPRREDRGPRRDDRRPDPRAAQTASQFPDETAPLGGDSPSAPAIAATHRPSASIDSAWELPGGDAPTAALVEEELGPIRIVDEPQPPRDPDGDDVFIDLTESPAPRGALVNLTGIKFREAGTIHEYDAGDVSYLRGERVMVESERGPTVGIVAIASRRAMASDSLKKILKRAAAEEDRARQAREKREAEAFQLCRDRARERKMPMKLIRAEMPSAGKVMFYFASEERIDFRELVRDLSHKLHGRIEMRQVGARDEAKMVGGIGDCGRELCCSTFLPSFAPVSIKMAKDQGLVLNPSRVTGQCGRLKCCLVYEHALYQEMRKTLPKVGKRVSTPAGDGRVVELDVIRQQVRVGFLEGGTQTFPASSVSVLAPPGAPQREPEPEPDPEPEPEPTPQ
jgi:cell fate regulator YaaT (PSP1 superfamily)